MAYIDALFISACAVTQAGLNPIDINSLKLYQQITIYVVCTLTTPIFIHSFVAFLRLYWFERYFDDIREASKLNFKMRRTATMAARTQTMDRQRSAENNFINRSNQLAAQLAAQSASQSPQQSERPLPESKASNQSSALSTSSQNQSDLEVRKFANGVQHLSEPSSEDEHRGVYDQIDVEDGAFQSQNIKFGELPKPKKHTIEPRDVMMSVSMLRNNNQTQKDSPEDQGPALVINGPAEREHQRNTQTFQFSIEKKKRPLHHRKRSGLKKRSFLFNRLSNYGSEDDDDDDDDDEEDYEGDAEDNVTSDGPGATNETDGLNGLERAQSNLQLPSADQTGGLKFGKRSNTLDVLRKRGSFAIRTPTFENMVKKPTRSIRRRFSSNAVSDNSYALDTGSETDTDDEDISEFGLRRAMSTNYLSWNPKVGRNSVFVDLSQKQKEELGGVEYRSIKLLTRVLVVYYVGFHILGFVLLVPWITNTHRYQPAVSNSGVSLSWWGFFTSMSSFNDLGYTLTADSMVQFITSPYALLVMSFFIVIGNTGFPILLRFIIWVMFKLSRDLSLLKESLGFLLDHPRRCFTLLFPSSPTWWLLFILVTLNVVDLVLFIILDIGATVLDGLTVGEKILAGFFQAVSTRTAGFACVDLSLLHPAVQVSYMVMMYISVLPLAISIRRTNVYEEQSLGVYMGGNKDTNDEHEGEGPTDNSKPTSFIGAHLRKQLSFDLWFVFLGLFIVCIAEGGRIRDVDLPEFNVFQVMFEVVSAYGTVGLSLGYPGSAASFSAQFNTVSKLVIVAMVIRGRHRGLPYSLDRAIMLPSDKMELRDEFQNSHAGHRLGHTETVGSAIDPVFEFFKSAAPSALRKNFKRPSFFSAKSSNSASELGSRGNYRAGSSSHGLNNPHNISRPPHNARDSDSQPMQEDQQGQMPSSSNQAQFEGNAPIISVASNGRDTRHSNVSLSPRSSVVPTDSAKVNEEYELDNIRPRREST
jgi:potassium uptake Trk family protein